MKRKKINLETKLFILSRQNNLCNYCGTILKFEGKTPLFDIDHIECISKSFDDTLDNLQALCLICHRIKTSNERLINDFNNKNNDVVSNGGDTVISTLLAYCYDHTEDNLVRKKR